jgi:Family of unknown function (DUF6165)
MMKLINTPVSFGEVVDKITILEIKSERIEDPEKTVNIRNELELLEAAWREAVRDMADVSNGRSRLKAVNEELWDIEDKIRLKEKASSFDDEFIQLARSVYFTNDRRADIKKEINLALGSELIEEKSYQDYS